MKPTLIILVVLILITGCVVEKVSCPKEKAYFLGPDGRIVVMEKGFFDKKEGRWITEKEFNLFMENYQKQGGNIAILSN